MFAFVIDQGGAVVSHERNETMFSAHQQSDLYRESTNVILIAIGLLAARTHVSCDARARATDRITCCATSYNNYGMACYNCNSV